MPPDADAFDAEVALQRLDAIIETQLALIMGHPSFVTLREAWLALGWLVERLPDDDKIGVAILSVTLSELRDDLGRPQTEQALYGHFVRDVYGEGDALPWTVLAVHPQVTVDDGTLIEGLADLAEASSTAVLLNAAPNLEASWSPPPRRESLRYAALLTPAIARDGWSLPASHAVLASMARSFASYRHESNCVGAGGHVEFGPAVPTRDEEEAVALAARGIASWSSDGNSVHFAQLPSLVLPRDIESFGPHDGWLEAWLPYLLYGLRFVRIMRLAARHVTADQDPEWELGIAVHKYVTDSHVHDEAFRLSHPLRAAKMKTIGGELWTALMPTFKFRGCLFRLQLRVPLPPHLRTE